MGDEVVAPDGHPFFVDPNLSGAASRLRVAEIFWGRLADVHDIDADGAPSVEPVFRQIVIDENLASDGDNYELQRNPITQATRLVILRRRGRPEPSPGAGDFDRLLRDAIDDLPSIIPRHDDGSSPEPFSFVARNACLMIRFDDVLQDHAQAELALPETVQLRTGYPPSTPQDARYLFDQNHGALIAGEFHSTRVLVDLTISEAESSSMPAPEPINSLGLPASQVGSGQPNVSLRLPTRADPASGQFELLRNLGGSPLATTANGPVDLSSPTLDVVRAMRGGNNQDANNGYLLDLSRPEIVGGWPLVVDEARAKAGGVLGQEFVVDLSFSGPCGKAPAVGDVLSVGQLFFEVAEAGAAPNALGRVRDVQVRGLGGSDIEPQELFGQGLFLTTFSRFLPVPTGCWVTFTPQAEVLPATSVPSDAQALIRFTEPVDPAGLSPFETFYLIRGDRTTAETPLNFVVGTLQPSADLKQFAFSPILPLSQVEGQADNYNFRFGEVRDLSGNTLADTPRFIEFTLDPSKPTDLNGGFALRFNDIDELPATLFEDLRGQFFYDLDTGTINPRPIAFLSFPADRKNPVPSIMVPFARGVQTPLSPLGSKLQTVWRYCDLGWAIRDETKYNVDVYGLNWSPIAGKVAADFYEEFEIRLSHSRFLPDEKVNQTFLVPLYGSSGLVGRPQQFAANILPNTDQKIVHPRGLGYKVDPVDLFEATSGTPMMPFPLNRGSGVPRTYTWRDTSILEKAAPAGRGVPLAIEVGTPLFIEDPPPGNFAPVNEVPTVGLPILMEYRCYPTATGVGLNAFDISLAVNSSPRPNFRAFSTGGLDQTGTIVLKNPDLELSPSGGFNPSTNPPGAPTSNTADNSFYIGQLDVVTRVSRVHTVWINTFEESPDYIGSVLLPEPALQPQGTNVLIDFRGASNFPGATGLEPFDARELDPYGDLPEGATEFHNGVSTWTSDINAIDGASFLQLRITFLSDIASMRSPSLSSMGIAFDL